MSSLSICQYVRSNTKVQVDVDKLLKDNGTLTCSDHEVANRLNDFLLVCILMNLHLRYQHYLTDQTAVHFNILR